MPEPTTLNAADIRRAYICPTWFKKHLEITYELDPPDSPQEVTRAELEYWLPGILQQDSRESAVHHVQGLIEELRTTIENAWSLADPEHRGLLEDVWLREKNLFVGVAAFVSSASDHLTRIVSPRVPLLPGFNLQPCAVGRYADNARAIRFRISSSVSDESQIRADCALGCEAHALSQMSFERFHVQEIVIGRRSEQWYENPLCRYWRHDNGSISVTGLTPDGKQCRAPHWRKVPVFSPESTDPNEIETMWAHVEWLMKQPEFNAGEILPDPVVMEIGDHQQAQFADALRVIEQGLAETPIRNYTACDNPLFFPHGCPLKKECWG